jgi:cardiolipin synthase
MQEIFLEDWFFATRESLPWRAPSRTVQPGSSPCRVIGDGPNEEFEKTRHLLLGIMAWTEKKLRIMTPYFVPDRVLIAGLQHAALRGVEVDLILPAVNNLPLVAWASRAYLWEIILRGVRVYEQPAPFAHSKVLTADGTYALVGSSNLDNRSLRLNFECNLEIYDRKVARQLEERFDEIKARSRRLTLEGLNGEPLVFRLRNSACKLLSPLL